MTKIVIAALLVSLILQEIQIISLQKKVSNLESFIASVLANEIQKIFVHTTILDKKDNEDTGA